MLVNSFHSLAVLYASTDSAGTYTGIVLETPVNTSYFISICILGGTIALQTI